MRGKADKQSRIGQLVAGIMKGYQPGQETGFSVGAGVLTTEHGLNESAVASFENEEFSGVQLSLSTNTVGNVVYEDHPLSDINEEKQWLSNEGILLEVIEDEQRTINGMEGYEGIVAITENNETEYRFTWHVNGEPKNALKPKILIKAQIPQAHYEAFQEEWEAILNSFRLR